jgi:predicted dehydrogenase
MDRQNRWRATPAMADQIIMNENRIHPTRREFLTATVAFTVAAGTSPLAALEDKPIRVVVIGTGGRGSDLIRKLSTIENAQIVGICDDYEPHLSRASKFAGPQAKTFSDYREMLEKLKPQAVVVAVPLYLHFKVCDEAIEHGCAVFCEKTMCYSIDEERKLAAKVRETKTVFQVGLQRRANGIYKQAKAMIDSGMLGQITAIKAQWHRNNNWRRPVPVERKDASWNALEKRLNWRLYRQFSQGLMTELGSHQLDVANWMLGAYPKRVMASGGIDYWRDGREVPDNIFCIYDYDITPAIQKSVKTPYTVRVTYSSLCNNAFEGASELIMGTRGSLLLTEKKGLLYSERGPDDVGWAKQNAAGSNASIVTSGKTLSLANDPWVHRGKPTEIDADGDETRDQLVSFLDSVREKDPKTICDVNEGLRNTVTALIANQAVENGESVEYPFAL